MQLVKYLGPPQSGSQADVTASRNQWGQYFRARTPPTQPTSVFADGSRALFRDAVSDWDGLSDEERAAWRAAEQTRHDSLGVATGLSGRSLFLRQRLISLEAAPAGVTLPVDIGPRAIDGLRVESLSAGQLAVAWDSASPLPAGPWLQVQMTLPLTPGSVWLPGRRLADKRPASWGVVQVVTPGDVSPLSIVGTYNGRWGSGPTSGDRLGWRIRSAGSSWYVLAQGLVVVA